jgi:hypothetical protein
MVEAHEIAPNNGWASQIRVVALALIALDLTLIGGDLLLYQPLLAQPNALTYVLEPVITLLAYAAVTLWVTRPDDQTWRMAVRTGTIIGLVGGILFIINLSSETFLDLPAPISIFATAPFFLGTFALWGVAGYLAARQTSSVQLGLLAAIWSAMCTILITITFGFSLGYLALPRLQQNLANSPEYARSGWSDLHAYALANLFDSAFAHLLTAIFIATVLGTLGSLFGVVRARQPLPSA